MPVTVTIQTVAGPTWVSDDELAELSDEELVELLQEDIPDLLDGATWTIQRNQDPKEGA